MVFAPHRAEQAVPELTGRYGAGELAQKIGLDTSRHAAFKKALERLRRANKFDASLFDTVENRGPNEPEFVFKVEDPRVQKIIQDYTK
jgi:hypothetical protein